MLITKLKQQLSGQFIRNVSWMGGAELVNRIFRLVTTFTLARLFSPKDYGLAAIVMTTFEFASVLSLKEGFAAKIIQADAKDVAVISDTSYWLHWIICGLLCILQCLAAVLIAQFYGNNQLILPICAVALVYLMFPIYKIQYALIIRENRLKVIALCNASQSILANIFTVIFALLGMGVWAVVWPMVLSTPVWIVICLKQHSWRPPTSFKLDRWQEIVNFGKNILGVDLLNKLVANLDYLIVGRFLGIEALGVYFFAFNAGLGISLSVADKFISALFPHLCEVRDNSEQLKQRYFSSLKTLAIVFVPLIVLQSSLAPFYVPIIFGQKWVIAVPILITICLSALPRPFWFAASMLLDAVDKTHITLRFNLIFTVGFAAFILLAVNWGIFWVAVAVLVSHLLLLPIFTVWSSRYVLGK